MVHQMAAYRMSRFIEWLAVGLRLDNHALLGDNFHHCHERTNRTLGGAGGGGLTPSVHFFKMEK